MAGLVRSLREEGLQVEHRFAISDSYYRGARRPFARVILRFRMYLEYPMRLAWACLWRRDSQVQVISTSPFFAPFVALLFAPKERNPVVHLVYDLFPDALIVAGRIGSDRYTAKCVRWVVRETLTRAAANVFLGHRLLCHAEAQFGPIPNAYIIPVGADAIPFSSFHPKKVIEHDAIDVLYCGNLGAMHDIETLLHSLKQAIVGINSFKNITFTFHASGPLYSALKERIYTFTNPLPDWIRFEEPLNDAAWIARMIRAHVALVTMKPGAEKVIMPSKTYSALAAGQAILAICPTGSDLAELVRTESCGWVVTPGNAGDLQSALMEITGSRDVLQQKRENAFKAGQGKYSETAVGKMWVELLERLYVDGMAG